MLKVRLYRGGRIEEEDFDPSRVSDLLAEDGTLVWLDLHDPTPEELALIQEEFSLHPLAIEDAEHRNQRPKLESYDDHDFLVFYGVALADGLRSHEIHAFVAKDYLITLRFDPAFDLTPVLKRWERHVGMTREGGGFLLYALLDVVVDAYFEVVEALEDASDEVEEDVLGQRQGTAVQERIFRLKKDLLEFRRLVMPLREMLAVLQQDEAVVGAPLRAYYRDVADHVLRVATFVDNVRELLTTALDAHLSQVSNRLNVVMRQVTSWAAIILIPTLITSFYGMNFERLPWPLASSWGWAISVGMMVASGGLLYLLFKRLDWL